MMALLCLGCGENLAQRAADRRALQDPPAEGAVDTWKAVFENVHADDEDDSLFHEGYERTSTMLKPLRFLSEQ